MRQTKSRQPGLGRAKKGPPKPNARTQPPTTGIKSLVPISDAGIRKKEQNLYNRRCRDIEQSTVQLKSFTEVDAPAYRAWLDLEFGPMIEECHIASRKIMELELTIESVNYCVAMRNVSRREAYREVKKAMDAGEDPCAWVREEMDDEEVDESEDDIFDETVKNFFRMFMDDDEDEWDDFSKYSTDGESKRRPKKDKQEHRPISVAENLLKATYRKIVARLHPDRNPNPTPRETEIWHQAQAAYADEDLQRLESLLKAIDSNSAASFDFKKMPVGEIIALRKDVERRLRAIKKSLTEVRRDPAWEFKKMQGNPRKIASHRREIQGSLQHDLDVMSRAQQQLHRIISKWEATKSPRKSSKSMTTTPSSQQQKDNFAGNWLFD